MSETEIDYLFSWDEIPGKDSDKLIKFLIEFEGLKWIRDAKIEKLDNGNTIKLSDEWNFLWLRLNNEKTEASLKSDGMILTFIVNTREGKLNVGIMDDSEVYGFQETKSFGTEKDLIKFLHESARGRRFWQERLKDKIEREKKALDLLHTNIGKFNKDILNQIFDLVDLSETYTWRWGGQLLSKRIRNRIFSNPTEKLNICINYLLNGEEPESVRIEKCLEDPNYKLNGTGEGLVTLFLYIKDPYSFNVMTKETIDGLKRLGRFDSRKGKRKWGEYYNAYNTAAKEFRKQYDLKPQSIDWVLTNISSHSIERKDNESFIGEWYEDDVIEVEEPSLPIRDDILKNLFNQAFKELGFNRTHLIDDSLKKMKQIADVQGKQLPEGWGKIAREKIKCEWAKDKPE